MPSPSLLKRLKERKLVQWALAYLAGAFVVFQGVEVMAEPWSISPALQRSVHVLLLIGLFVTLVLAWYHGEKGRQRVSGPELLMVAALLVVAGVALSTLSGRDGGTGPSEVPQALAVDDDRPGVAVLLCDNFSPNPEDAYRAQGIHEEILLRLQGISSLRSIGRTSVLRFAEDPPEVSEIATTLGVGFVGECSVLKDPNASQIRVTFQLLDASGTQVWADSYDRDLTVGNLLDIQSDIAQRITQAIGARLTQDEKARIGADPTENLEAYEAYLLGRYHLGREDNPVRGSSEALPYFEIAVERDANLAEAHAGLALAYYYMLSLGIRAPRETWPQVERWARSALAIDSTVSAAHLLLARQQLISTWDWGEADRRIRRVLELDPNDPEGWSTKADLLAAQGRIDEAWQAASRAAALDPISSRTLIVQTRGALLARRYEEATRLREVLVTRDPDNVVAVWYLVQSLLLGGQPEAVTPLLPDDSEEVARFRTEPSASLALLLSLQGDADSARVVIDRVVSGFGEGDRDPVRVWPTYAALGEKDEAIHWMEQSIQELSPSARFIGVDPLADPLRDDPRYQALLDRIGLGHLKARFDSLAAARPMGARDTTTSGSH